MIASNFPGTTRTRKAAAVRRAEIVEAAIQIISEKGYPGLTIQSVAERCSITTSGVMHHFVTKDDILIAVLRERERRDEYALKSLREIEFSMLEGRTQVRKMVLASMRAIVERNAGQPQMLKLVAVLRAEALNADHPAHEHFHVRMHAVLEIFTELFRSICEDPQSMARQFLSLMQGLEAQWISEDMAFDLVLEWDRAAERLLPERCCQSDRYKSLIGTDGA